MKYKNILTCTFIIMLFIASPLRGQNFSGRFTVSAYTWEQYTGSDSSSKYLKMFEGLQLNVSGLAGGKASVHSYIRFSGNLGEKQGNLEHGFYNLYLKIRKIKYLDEGVFGRQFVNTGVENGAIDGAKIIIDAKKYGRLMAFAGILVPWYDNNKIRNWDEGNFSGIQYTNSFMEKLTAGLTLFRKTRAQDSYTSPGRYTLQYFNISNILSKGLALNLKYDHSRKVDFSVNMIKGFSKFNHEIITDPGLDRLELSARVRPNSKLNLFGEFFYRKPEIYANSIFSVFTQHDNKEAWLRGSYQLRKNLFIYSNLAYVMFEDDNCVRFNAGVNTDMYSVGLNIRNGYGGKTTGITGSFQYPVFKDVLANASINLSRYKLDESTATLDDLLTSSAGLTYMPKKSYSLSIQGQGLRNKVYSNDIRFFVRGSYWFFSKKGIFK